MDQNVFPWQNGLKSLNSKKCTSISPFILLSTHPPGQTGLVVTCLLFSSRQQTSGITAHSLSTCHSASFYSQIRDQGVLVARSSEGRTQLSEERWMRHILCLKRTLEYLRENVLIKGDTLSTILWKPREENAEQFARVMWTGRRTASWLLCAGISCGGGVHRHGAQSRSTGPCTTRSLLHT